MDWSQKKHLTIGCYTLVHFGREVDFLAPVLNMLSNIEGKCCNSHILDFDCPLSHFHWMDPRGHSVVCRDCNSKN